MTPIEYGYYVAVDAKGATKPSVQWVKSKIDEAGCSGTPVSLRSDQEESIMALESCRYISASGNSDAGVARSRLKSQWCG
jgi:hypothetical protein